MTPRRSVTRGRGIDDGTLLQRRLRRRKVKVHYKGTGSIRTAHALNSAVPDLGSVASMVSKFVATSSLKWKVVNAKPVRKPGSIRTGTSIDPRRDDTRTRSPSASPYWI